MTIRMGQANRNSGLISDVKPCPLPNQITISLSRNMRVSTLRIARKRHMDKMVGMSERTM